MTNKREPLIKKQKMAETNVDQLHRLAPEEYSEAVEYMRVLEQTDVNEIIAVMNDRGSSNAMFPSGWKWTDWGENTPYPAKLAAALVKSQANESVTDLGNVYYGRRDLSPEAMEIFRQDAITNPLTKELMTEHGLLNLGDMVHKEPETMKKIFLTFSPQELQQFIEAEEQMSGGDMKGLLSQLGL